MKTYFLRPQDVWLFRDGRPFSAGSDHRARSLFPPMPSVIQGAIRTSWLIQQKVNLANPNRKELQAEIAKVVGSPDRPLNLCIRGPFLAVLSEDGKTLTRYFPQPADAVSVAAGHIEFTTPPEIVPAGMQTSSITPMVLGLNEQPSKPGEFLWLSEDHLKAYLKGEVDYHGNHRPKAVEGIESKEFFVRESRVGNMRSNQTHTTEEAQLYEVEYIRMRAGAGLCLEMEGFEPWPDQVMLSVGGERRCGNLERYHAGLNWPTPTRKLPHRFKIYFATPAYFSKGWQPADWGKFFNGNVVLQAAAIGRYVSIGGFDYATDQHKPALRYVPAGSVYYFTADASAHFESLPMGALTEFGAEMGYGQFLMEEW